MTSVFASVYLDEDVSVLVGDVLRARGFHAFTARDAGRLSRTDAEQLSFAVENRMAILTHNRIDFEDLHRRYLAEDIEHWGILIAARRLARLKVGL